MRLTHDKSERTAESRLISALEEQTLQTRMAQLTQENAHLQRMLEIAFEEARSNEKKLSAVNHFTSHQVRGTLTRIWGLANVLAKSRSLEEVHSLSTHLQKESSMLNDIISTVNTELNEESRHLKLLSNER